MSRGHKKSWSSHSVLEIPSPADYPTPSLHQRSNSSDYQAMSLISPIRQRRKKSTAPYKDPLARNQLQSLHEVLLNPAPSEPPELSFSASDVDTDGFSDGDGIFSPPGSRSRVVSGEFLKDPSGHYVYDSFPLQDLFISLANKERRVLEARELLSEAESELAAFKKKWSALLAEDTAGRDQPGDRKELANSSQNTVDESEGAEPLEQDWIDEPASEPQADIENTTSPRRNQSIILKRWWALLTHYLRALFQFIASMEPEHSQLSLFHNQMGPASTPYFHQKYKSPLFPRMPFFDKYVPNG